MKIAVFHELPFGGARRAVSGFSSVLKKKRKVDLYYIDEKSDNSILADFDSVNYFPFLPKKWNGNDWKARLYKDTFELISLYKLHQKIAIEINKKQYDIVFVHGSKYTQAPFILRFLSSKKVYYAQEVLRMVYEPHFKIPENLNRVKRTYEKIVRTIRKKIDRQNIQKADEIFCNSYFTKKNLAKAYGTWAAVCYMGIDTKIFYHEKIDKKFDILFIGLKDLANGYPLLMEAISRMKYIPDIRTVPIKNEWISDDSEMRKVYNQSKILVCLGYREPFGLLPLEAAACKVPTIALNDGGYKETVIDGKTGYLVTRNPQEIAKTLDIVLSSVSKRNTLGQNAWKNVQKNWSWERRTHEVLEKLT